MTAGTHDLTAECGATFDRSFRWTTSELFPVPPGGDPDAVPVDLTGWSARMAVRTFRDSPEPLVEISLGDGIAFDDEELGRFTLTITAEVMDTIPPGTAFYDVEFISPAEEVTRLLRGRFIVRQQATR